MWSVQPFKALYIFGFFIVAPPYFLFLLMQYTFPVFRPIRPLSISANLANSVVQGYF